LLASWVAGDAQEDGTGSGDEENTLPAGRMA
jgi:hypothetical protein